MQSDPKDSRCAGPSPASNTVSSGELASLIAERRRIHGVVTLELGCGPQKKSPRAIGVDVREMSAVDVVGDAVEVLRQAPRGSVDVIESSHFLEHLSDPIALLRQAERALRRGGTFAASVPHFSNPWYYSDLTHRTTFGLYTFSYLVEKDELFRRKVPKYLDVPLQFELCDVRLGFKSFRPRYAVHGLKRVFESFVNSNRWTQETYEEHFSWVVPAHEVTFTLRRLGRSSDS